jgi:hypothetical protein
MKQCLQCNRWKLHVRGDACNLCFTKHQANVHRLRSYRAAAYPELHQPIIKKVADRIIEELKSEAKT